MLRFTDTLKNKIFYRFKEKALEGSWVFYDLVRAELHDVSGVDVYSDELPTANISCFDFKSEGDDAVDFDKPRHAWKKCKLTDDDDGLYWEAESGKTGALTVYSIAKAEIRNGHVTLWVAPTEYTDCMAVVNFYKQVPVQE